MCMNSKYFAEQKPHISTPKNDVLIPIYMLYTVINKSKALAGFKNVLMPIYNCCQQLHKVLAQSVWNYTQTPGKLLSVNSNIIKTKILFTI